jgi:hypothetical protein
VGGIVQVVRPLIYLEGAGRPCRGEAT